jgi:hypothetical protein
VTQLVIEKSFDKQDLLNAGEFKTIVDTVLQAARAIV